MIEKRWLKNVAAGLLESFVSRNNDFIGYWASVRLVSRRGDEIVCEALAFLLSACRA